MTRRSLTVNGSPMFGHQAILTTLGKHSTTLRSGTGISFGYLLSYLSKWFRTMTGAWPCLRPARLNIKFLRPRITPVWLTRKVTILIFGLGCFTQRCQFTYQEDQQFQLTLQHTQIYMSCPVVRRTQQLNNSSSMDNLAAGEHSLWACSNLSQAWLKPMEFLAPLKQLLLRTIQWTVSSPITPTWQRCGTNTCWSQFGQMTTPPPPHPS